jgi:hypothetical protein
VTDNGVSAQPEVIASNSDPASQGRAEPELLQDSAPTKVNGRVSNDRFTSISLWVEVVKNLLTICAIIAGGWWFLTQRFDVPQVKLDQTISQRLLSGSTDNWLIAVDVHATNVGKIKVSLTNGIMQLRQINPDGYPLHSGTPNRLWFGDQSALADSMIDR